MNISACGTYCFVSLPCTSGCSVFSRSRSAIRSKRSALTPWRPQNKRAPAWGKADARNAASTGVALRVCRSEGRSGEILYQVQKVAVVNADNDRHPPLVPADAAAMAPIAIPVVVTPGRVITPSRVSAPTATPVAPVTVISVTVVAVAVSMPVSATLIGLGRRRKSDDG